MSKCESELIQSKSKLTKLKNEATELASSLSLLNDESVSVDTALISLQAAVEAIKALDKKHVSQVRVLKKPPKVHSHPSVTHRTYIVSHSPLPITR